MSLGNNSIQFLNHPQYPQSFTPVKMPKQKKFVYNNYRLVISSTDRDRSIYRNPNEFKLELPRRYRNVAMVECGLIILPNFSNIEKYFLIQVQELNDGPYDSLDPDLSKAIAVVPNRNGLDNYNYILETPGDTSYIKNYIKKFVDTPLASLSTFTLKIKKPDGNLINFGNDLWPYDREYFFSEGYVNATNPINGDVLSITSNNHDLSDNINSNNDSDVVNIYDSTITYDTFLSNGSLKRITKSFPDLDGSYFKLGNTSTLTLLDNNVFTIKVSQTVQNELTTANYPNWVLGGKWKRAKHTDGYYSRIKISSVSISDKIITVTTASNHHLQAYDRIYIDNIISTPKTRWFKNYHVVTERTNDTQFKLHTQNITLDDVTQNLLLDAEYLEQDEPESTNINTLTITPDLNPPGGSGNNNGILDHIIYTDNTANIDFNISMEPNSSIWVGPPTSQYFPNTDSAASGYTSTDTYLYIDKSANPRFPEIFDCYVPGDKTITFDGPNANGGSIITILNYTDYGNPDFPVWFCNITWDPPPANNNTYVTDYFVDTTTNPYTYHNFTFNNIDNTKLCIYDKMNGGYTTGFTNGWQQLTKDPGVDITSINLYLNGSISVYLEIYDNSVANHVNPHTRFSGLDPIATSDTVTFKVNTKTAITFDNFKDSNNNPVSLSGDPPYYAWIREDPATEDSHTVVSFASTGGILIGDIISGYNITETDVSVVSIDNNTDITISSSQNFGAETDISFTTPGNAQSHLTLETTYATGVAAISFEYISVNNGYLQKYGDPDPTIQSLFIFNINSREEDDEHVRSENIAYGNL